MPDLASRLEALGFNVFFDGDDAATKARWLRHAVREFQIYASMPYVARARPGPWGKRWLDPLERVANAARYTGPKDGDPNAAGFDACVSAWEQASYRCPVVVEIYYSKKTALEPLPPGSKNVEGNYWRYDDPRLVTFVGGSRDRAKTLRVRVCDLTGHFCAPHGTDLSQMALAGGISLFSPVWRGGYVMSGSDADEMLPETLVGSAWDQIADASTKATFRVVRAVSEFEAKARFDGINGYDDAVVSFGPFNWALAPAELGKKAPTPDHLASAGELACYLAYWAGREAADAARLLKTPFALEFSPPWPPGHAGPKKPSWPATRNYVGFVDWPPLEPAGNDPVGKRKLGDLEWMRTTHWLWRWLALARHAPTFRRRQWDLGRARLRDILAFEIDPSDRPGKAPGTKKVALGRMFTSEAAVTLLVRCHVRKAGFLHAGGFRHPSLRLALAFANLPADVATWGQAEQDKLIEAMLATAAFGGLTSAERKKLEGASSKLYEHRQELATRPVPKSGLYADCRALAEWPREQDFRWHYAKPPKGKYALPKAACANLSHAHGSFSLDKAGLPPMPS